MTQSLDGADPIPDPRTVATPDLNRSNLRAATEGFEMDGDLGEAIETAPQPVTSTSSPARRMPPKSASGTTTCSVQQVALAIAAQLELVAQQVDAFDEPLQPAV